MQQPNEEIMPDEKAIDAEPPKPKQKPLKERIYKAFASSYFCPNCHREVSMPFKGANIMGTIKIACRCQGGAILIKIEGKPEQAQKPALDDIIEELHFCGRCKTQTVHKFIKGTEDMACVDCYDKPYEQER